jgi:peptide/nickel transport system permease protein
MEAHAIGNAVVAALGAGGAALAFRLRGSPFWRERTAAIARRAPLAAAVVALYVAVALLDSIAWRDRVQPGTVAAPRSLLDRAFPHDFDERSYSAPFAAVELAGGAPLRHPGAHWLGTDILGRDVLHLALGGARVALLIGGLTSAIAIPLALLFGVAAGFYGRRVDDLVLFVLSTLASIPSLLLLIALVLVLGHGTVQVCVALAVTSWVGLCRIVRGETLKIRELDYVAAARALGVSNARILLRHVLPNLSHLVVVTAVLSFSQLVLSEAILSWLGVGVDGSWGQMIDQARDELARDPIIGWNLGAASAALFGLILAVNRLGDAVRDVLDPRTLRERA